MNLLFLTRGLASFVQEHATRKVEMNVPEAPAPEAVSEPVPSTNDGPVKIVVGSTFKSMVLDGEKASVEGAGKELMSVLVSYARIMSWLKRRFTDIEVEALFKFSQGVAVENPMQ